MAENNKNQKTLDEKLKQRITFEFEQLLQRPEYIFQMVLRSRHPSEKEIAKTLGFRFKEKESGKQTDIILGFRDGLIPLIDSFQFGGATEWVQFSEPRQIQKMLVNYLSQINAAKSYFTQGSIDISFPVHRWQMTRTWNPSISATTVPDRMTFAVVNWNGKINVVNTVFMLLRTVLPIEHRAVSVPEDFQKNVVDKVLSGIAKVFQNFGSGDLMIIRPPMNWVVDRWGRTAIIQHIKIGKWLYLYKLLPTQVAISFSPQMDTSGRPYSAIVDMSWVFWKGYITDYEISRMIGIEEYPRMEPEEVPSAPINFQTKITCKK